MNRRDFFRVMGVAGLAPIVAALAACGSTSAPAASAPSAAPNVKVKVSFAAKSAIYAPHLNVPQDKVPTPDMMHDYGLMREIYQELKSTGWKPQR